METNIGRGAIRLLPVILVIVAVAAWFNDVQDGGLYVRRNLVPVFTIVLLTALTLVGGLPALRVLCESRRDVRSGLRSDISVLAHLHVFCRNHWLRHWLDRRPKHPMRRRSFFNPIILKHAKAASLPLLPWATSARAIAWSWFSQVRIPNPSATD